MYVFLRFNKCFNFRYFGYVLCVNSQQYACIKRNIFMAFLTSDSLI